ncbi:peptidoglycan editing factor PgeF [Ferrimonas senticii]|uniref:peptidoglycan editing factor PgeF n=1 Tax=Ferrimonas senticii TaxID=394566 RepID=UPI00041757A8|nr:peptidoglycan editing factor PgeF [Ferrimonas senticii]
MWLRPDWPAPSNVLALSTTRFGGRSIAAFRGLNLGDHVGDHPELVAANRAIVQQRLPADAQIQWLSQVHGTTVLNLPLSEAAAAPEADASYSNQPQQFCAVMTADCLPLLLCDVAGREVAAVHAGWRGLCDGIIEQAVTGFSADANQLLAWLGPAIGPSCFEVGAEVRQAFIDKQAAAASAFTRQHNGKYLADIYALARRRLQAIGVSQIYGGDLCTVSDPSRFYSYRRSGTTGRQASLIGLLR